MLNLVNYPVNNAGTGGVYGTGNYTAAQLATLTQWIKASLNSGGGTTTGSTNYGGKFNFTDDYGL